MCTFTLLVVDVTLLETPSSHYLHQSNSFKSMMGSMQILSIDTECDLLNLRMVIDYDVVINACCDSGRMVVIVGSVVVHLRCALCL